MFLKLTEIAYCIQGINALNNSGFLTKLPVKTKFVVRRDYDKNA